MKLEPGTMNTDNQVFLLFSGRFRSHIFHILRIWCLQGLILKGNQLLLSIGKENKPLIDWCIPEFLREFYF